MITTTTNTVEGYAIQYYLGIITGEAVMGANFVKDMFANIRDVVGGRAKGYENELRRARDHAFQALQEQAVKVGANAIVGISFAYSVMGQKNGMMMVSISGTAVQLACPPQPSE